MLLPTLRWLAVDYPQVVTFTSVNLYWLLGEVERHERRSCAESPRRAPPAGNLAPGPRHAALGRRDRRAGRHHAAGGLPAPAGPQGRRPGRRRHDGTRRLYQIRPEGLESLDQFLAELWPAGLRRLKAAVESDTVETVEAAVEADDR